MSFSRGKFSARVPVIFVSTGVDRAKQSMKDSCDINLLMARYLRSGNIDHLAKHEGQYGVVDGQTFHEAMNVVAKAEEMFADLPSALRKRFGNSPKDFLSFMSDSANVAEMRKLGLATAALEPPPTALARRLDELATDREARLELARRAVVVPPVAASAQ